jgi:hypothetical protein
MAGKKTKSREILGQVEEKERKKLGFIRPLLFFFCSSPMARVVP